MSSQQQRLGRVAVNSTLAVILVLVAILSPFVGAPTANVAAIAAAPAAAWSHAGRTPDESWLITSEYYANEYIATYLVDIRHYDDCLDGAGQSLYHYRADVLDPTRYAGTGPVTLNTVMPYKPNLWHDNDWTINSLSFVLGGFETSSLRESSGCGSRERHRETGESLAFTEYMTSDVLAPLNGSGRCSTMTWIPRLKQVTSTSPIRSTSRSTCRWSWWPGAT